MTLSLLSDSEILSLAARTFTVQNLALLAPHKVALLSVEQQAAFEMQSAVRAARDLTEQFRVSRRNLRAVHIVASRLARRHAEMEFMVFGVPIPAVRSRTPPLDYLNSASEALRVSLRDPTLSLDEKVRRAGLASTVVANRAYTETQIQAYRDVMELDDTLRIRKVWVMNESASTPPCKYCRRLHGTAVDVDRTFPVPRGASVFGPLVGPPMHPNCRCRVMAKLMKTDPAA